MAARLTRQADAAGGVLQALRQHAAEGINRAAGGERHDDADGFRGPGLRAGVARGEGRCGESEGGGEMAEQLKTLAAQVEANADAAYAITR